MRFVTTKTLAGELRGKHIADSLGVPWAHQYTEPAEWVVFVKTFSGMAQAKRDGCRIAMDPVDHYCYDDGRALEPRPEVDMLIIPNPECARGYKGLFPNADFMVVPHQWDARITGECEHDLFRPGYIGRRFNLSEMLGNGVEMVINEDEQLAAMPRFNCHIAHRAWQAADARKPATKVASAAAVGAVIVTTPDASARHLLGPDYPFYAPGTVFDALYQARKAFGTERWEQAREVMRQVKEKTSLQAIVQAYKLLM